MKKDSFIFGFSAFAAVFTAAAAAAAPAHVPAPQQQEEKQLDPRRDDPKAFAAQMCAHMKIDIEMSCTPTQQTQVEEFIRHMQQRRFDSEEDRMKFILENVSRIFMEETAPKETYKAPSR